MTLLPIKKYIKKINTEVKENIINPLIVRNQSKIFCIGMNKSGTTSFKVAMMQLGFVVGNQRKAEALLPYFKEGYFDPIISYCQKAQVFQDFPFSMPHTYKFIDEAFPGSRFILTIRDSSEQWYNSLVQFHSKLYGKGSVPTREDLKNATYLWEGRPFEVMKLLGVQDDDIYNKAKLVSIYEKHLQDAKSYFRDRPDDFLIVNVARKNSLKELTNFLKIQNNSMSDFPWEKKTLDITRGRK